MKLSSSNGTAMVMDYLTEAREKIGRAFELVTEINEGNYKAGQEPMQFDYVSCPVLSDKVDSLMSIIKKLDAFVYQER